MTEFPFKQLVCVCVTVRWAAAVNTSLHCCVSCSQGRDTQPCHIHSSIPCPIFLEFLCVCVCVCYVKIIRCVLNSRMKIILIFFNVLFISSFCLWTATALIMKTIGFGHCWVWQLCEFVFCLCYLLFHCWSVCLWPRVPFLLANLVYMLLTVVAPLAFVLNLWAYFSSSSIFL